MGSNSSSKRREFPRSVKEKVHERAGGICEECGERDGEEYDHIVECWEGGKNNEDNCKLLCRPCHLEKSRHSTHLRAKGKRFAVQKGRKRSGKIKSAGFKKGPKRKWPKRSFQKRAK